MNVKNKLPQGWVECKLEDILIKLCNGTSKKQNKNASGVPVTRIETISDGVINFNRVGYISEISSEDIDTYKLICGDILFSNINSDFHLGKTAIYYGNELLLHGMNLLLIRLSKEIVLPSFINYYLNYCRFTGKFIKIAQHAVNQSSINQTKLKNFEIFLPPLNEQKRIVEKIEEEFGKIDEGVEKLKLTQEQIKQYRQSVLKSAFEGKLYKTTEWEEKTLEEITSYIQRGKSPKYSEEENNYFIINQKCIRWNNLQCEFKKFVTPVFWDSLSQERFLQAGDILWNSTGTGTIGRAYLFKGDELNSAIVDSHVTIVRVKKDDILSKFLFYFIMSPFVQYKIETMQNGSTNQVELGRTEIKNTRINLPTIDEQKQIVAEIEKRFKVADEAERVITENLEKAEQLKQSILKKAFEGRLVPQNPTDQPASELLAQIQTERNK